MNVKRLDDDPSECVVLTWALQVKDLNASDPLDIGKVFPWVRLGKAKF